MNNQTTLEKFSRKSWLVLILFGTIGQIAWAVENMYFNLFVFDTVAPDLGAITLMVQLSGVVATVATLIAGVLSDKVGNRRSFIAWGYLIWGVTVALFGCTGKDTVGAIFSVSGATVVSLTLALLIVGDCVMTLFGSTANDAAFNAWVTDNTRPSYRGTVEGVLAILPLIAMLAVAGGFGILVSFTSYRAVFIGLGAIISISGAIGIFVIKDSPRMEKSGRFRDILYGFRPSVIKANLPLYATFLVVVVYGIACQIFMPYLIIYMKTYLGFTVLEYSLVFGIAIVFGAVINVILGRISDRHDKVKLMYVAAGVMAVGLFGMYFAPATSKTAALVIFGIFGFVMICGYIFVSALCGSTMRDYTPEGAVGKLQGVRMVFSVLIPMLVGPAIGNGINKLKGDKLLDAGADIMTTEYIPAPEIFLVAGFAALLMIATVPLIGMARKGYKAEP